MSRSSQERRLQSTQEPDRGEPASSWTLRHVLGKVRWRALEAFGRRNVDLRAVPRVSFTFDDFPQSASHIGGSILKSYGVRGTYYAAIGLMNQVNELGRQFDSTDLKKLLGEGHELGSHTYDHVSPRTSSYWEFQANVLKGMSAVDEISGGSLPRQFSYPKGHVTLRAKRGIGRYFASCRGIVPGINRSPVDVNLLRANSIYSWSLDEVAIERLFEVNEILGGWLIFYTHDISDKPSAFGCKPGEFESVVAMAIRRRSIILPVGEVLTGEATRQEARQ